MSFKWAKIHKRERDGLVGSNEYDIALGKDGLPPFLNPVMIIARQRAREWLADQPNNELIFFSLERTLDMYTYRDTGPNSKWEKPDPGDDYHNFMNIMTDAEVDALIACTERSTTLRWDWANQVNYHMLSVSDHEAEDLWKKIEIRCREWEVSHV